MTKTPTYDQMMNPTCQARQALGGSGTIEEINNRVAKIAKISDEQLEGLHHAERGSQTEVEYPLAWSKTHVKQFGVLENSSRGVWALTTTGREVDGFDADDGKRFIKNEYDPKKTAIDQGKEENELDLPWHAELLQTRLAMKPDALERLIQRLPRESSFLQAEVTGKSSGGGMDGKGLRRIGNRLSFQVFFQHQQLEQIR